MEIEFRDLKIEITGSDKYLETEITSKTKLDRCLTSLEKESHTERQIEISCQDDELSVRNENQILPRLNISIFNGDCSDCLDFWNSFEVAIHNNKSLSNIVIYIIYIL